MSTTTTAVLVVAAVACATPALAHDGLRDRVDQLLGCAAFQPGDVSQQQWDECLRIPYMCGDAPTPGCLEVTAARFDGGRKSTGPTRGIHHERTAPSRRDQGRRPSSELGASLGASADSVAARSATQLATSGGSAHSGANANHNEGGSFGRDVATGAGAVAGNRACGAACGVAGGAAAGRGYDFMNRDPYRESDQHHEGGGRDGAYGDDMSGGEAAGDGVTGGDQGY
jgi:hypothetical protein